METVLYGGAFDPPHLGHEHIIRSIAREFGPRKIILVPSGWRQDKTYKVSPEHRLEILSLFAQDLQDIDVELCTDFMLNPSIDGTTLGVDAYFSQKLGYSSVQVFGTDVIPNMSEWDPSGRVEREIPKIFVIRKGASLPSYDSIDNYSLIEPTLPEDVANLSSTLIRENVKKDVFEGLSPKIREYIRCNELYL